MICAKFAVIVRFVVIDAVQVFVEIDGQFVQEEKRYPVAGVAVRVTLVP